MRKVHIANTFFEWELETQNQCSLSVAFEQHAIFRQLQFLPLIYAACDEGVLLNDLPQREYWQALKNLGICAPQTFCLSDPSLPPDCEIESWGPSRLIASFAAKHKLSYCMPKWEIVRQVNSKRFSFETSPKLPHAALLCNEAEAKQWLSSFSGKKVLKTCYGVSGKGHLIIDNESLPWERIASFLKQEWKKELPVIAEPWQTRILDFSTQWIIGKNKEIEYLGSTLCMNDERGQYRFNQVGEEALLFQSHLPFLKEHIYIARTVLEKIAHLGFFGNVGIDAMLYSLPERPQEPLLHPIVEINARKTMGWAALMFQKRHFPNRIVRFSYALENQGYLPPVAISKEGKEILFRRNLSIAVCN